MACATRWAGSEGMTGVDEQTGRVALVTGASRGIGRAIAGRLAADGFFVVGTATSEAGAGTIGGHLGDAGRGLVMRVEDETSVEAAFADMTSSCGAPLVIVNNAGVTRDNLLMRMKSDEWQTVVDTNLGSLYRVIKPALRAMMKARWGRIINLSSVVARMGNPGQSNYVASKAGIEGFTRSLAHEVASRGITVNAVAPGFIDTDMTAELTEAQIETMLERIPLGRMGAPEDIADAVAFLASERAGYITGETLQVNGGLYMG
jgi:3-oxoacyl-[acyl-carrier protein] reductase